MKYGSVCSGIEAASVAWEPLGWEPLFFAEIARFPSAVLAQRWPNVPNLGDFTRIGNERPIELLVGGTPCQSFSVAGLRGGMDDARGQLSLEFLRLAQRTGPRWVVWENVPGVLSSNGGRDFGSFLGGLEELGYGWAYRILDAQHVRVDGYGRAVPQRRRRVFVVGCLGDWRRAAAVLFERESLSGNPSPRRTAGKGIAGNLAQSVAGCLGAHKTGGWGNDLDNQGAFIPCMSTGQGSAEIGIGIGTTLNCNHEARVIAFSAKDHGGDAMVECSPTLRAGGFVNSHANAGVMPAVVHALKGNGFDASEDGTGRGVPLTVAFSGRSRGAEPKVNRAERPPHHMIEMVGALDATKPWNVANNTAVRRLMPVECERLQGFPDGYTSVNYRGKPAADGPRYQAIGNSMAVNVMRWIGRRIEMCEADVGRMEGGNKAGKTRARRKGSI